MKTKITFLKFSLLLSFIFLMSSFSQACDYQLKMIDSYGDGWNGGKVTVLVNGVAVLVDQTVSTGSGPIFVTFSVANADLITTVYTGGSYAYENEYYIIDNDGITVASQGAGGNTPSSISSAISAVCPLPCEYQLKMIDSYGDGWNGGMVSVLVNGATVLSNQTVSTGSGPIYASFFAFTGDSITTSYIAGSWSAENEYYIIDPSAATIASQGAGGTTPGSITTAIIANCPSCLPSSNFIISSLSATGAQLNWTSGGSSLYNIEFGPSGFTPGTGTIYNVSTDTFKVVSGLAANTSYDWYVQDSCGVGNVSAWIGPNSFITNCNAISSFPITENFDGTWAGSPAAPDCWTVINNNNDSYLWSRANDYISPTHSGTYAAHGMGNTDDYLITPQLDFTGVNTIIKWWDKVESSSYPNTYHVLVSTTNKDASSFTIDLGTYTCTNTAWTEHSIVLSAYTNQTIYIAFHQTASGSPWYGFGIDDVSIEVVPVNEIEISEITGNYTGFGAGNYIVKAIVKNNGVVAQTSIPMNYTLDGVGTVSETMASLAPFTTDTFTFATAVNSGTSGTHNIAVYSALSGDEDLTNDTAFAEVRNLDFAYTDGFETYASNTIPNYWNVINTTVSTSPYAKAYSSATGTNTGSQHFRMYNSSYTAGELIAVLPRMNVDMSTIRFELWVKGGGSDLIIGVLDDPNDTATFVEVDTIFSYTTMSEYAIMFDSYTGSGKYIGLKHGMNSTADYIYIDDINIYAPLANDIQVVQFLGSYGGLGVTSTDTVTVIVKNSGSTAQTSIPMKYSLDNATVVTETMTSLAAFTTDTFTFATTYDATAGGQHTLVAYSDLSNDGDNSNDTAMTSFITNEVMTVPSSYDFLTATDLYFLFNQNTYSSAGISVDANSNQGNGIKLEGGSSSSGWSSYSTVTQAFANTTHVATADAKIDAGGVSYLFMDFDFKSYCKYYPSNYTWFRVMLNDTVYAKTLDGDSVWLSNSTNGDPWQTIKLNLSQYAGTIFSISFQGALKYNEANYSPGNIIYIDNINLYVPPANEIEIVQFLGNYGGLGVTSTDTVSVLIKNNGISPQVSIPIKYTLDNGTVISESMTSLAAFTTDTFTFATTYDATAGGQHSLIVYSDLSNDENRVNDTIVKDFITYGTHTIPFTEDFEAGFTYFDNDAINTTGFQDNTTLYHSGNHSVRNAYTTSIDDKLIEAGTMDLTASTTPVLDFWHIAKTEGNYDKCFIEISTDNGQTWVALDDSLYLGMSPNYAVKGYFHENSYSEWGTGYDIPDNSWWKMERFNLTPFKDDSVRVRYRITSDGSVQRDGWDLDDITIQEEPAAVAALGNDTSICFGSDITLMANTNPVGYTYLWTVDGDTVFANTTNTLTTDSAGTYAVEVTGLNTVTYDNVVVSINALPTVAVTGNDTICYGDSTMLAANFTGASPWSFDINVGGSVFSDNSANTLYQKYQTPNDTTSYTIVSITDGNGCVQTTHSDTITIIVNTLPIVAQSSLADVCDLTSVFTLTSGSPANGTYSGLGVNTSTSTFNSTTAGAGNHDITYVYTDANGCTDSASTIQVVNALPSINATAGANPVPYNTSTTLNAVVSNAVGNLAYSWTPTASVSGSALLQTVNTIDIITAKSYVVNVYDSATTCQNTDTVDLVYSGGPISVNPIAVPSSVCYGDTTQLKAQASGGNGTIDYTWTSNPAGYGAIVANPFASLTQDTWFIVYATDGANSAMDSVLVTVLASPTVTYNTDTTFVCIGSETYAIANLTGSAPYSYTYNGIIVSGIANAIDSIMVNTTTDVMYRLTSITDNNGCTSTGNLDSMLIHVNALPTIAVSDNDTMCYGDSVMLTMNFTGASPWSYDVFDGTSTMSQNATNAITDVYAGPMVSTNYKLTSVTDNNGCVTTGNLDSVYILVNSLPTVVASDNDSICYGDSAQISLTFTGAAPYSFSVNDGSSVFSDNSAINAFTAYAGPIATTNYVLVDITDANGCNTSGLIDSIEIFVHALPAKPSFTGLNADYCVDAADASLTPNPIGGTFTGTGVTGNFFSPATAGAGSYDVVYTVTDVNNCSNGDTMSTIVNALPVVQLSGLAAAYCIDDMATTLVGSSSVAPPMPTTYCSVASNNYTYEHFTNVSLNGATQTSIGSYYTDYSASTFTSLYTDSTYTISGTYLNDGGEYIFAFIDWNRSGTFDAGESVSIVTGSSGSETSFTANFTVPSTASIGMTKMRMIINWNSTPNGCTNPSYGEIEDYKIEVASPVGGVFTGLGINGNVFTPALAGAGSKVITYTYIDGNNCSNFATQSTMVNSLPTITVPTLSAVCIDEADFSLTGATPSGGTWSGTGVSSNVFSPATAGAGTFMLTFAVTDANTCYNSDSTSILVNALPVLTLPTLSGKCVDAANFALIGASPSAGTWSGTGVSANSFSPATAGVGTFMLTYSFTDANTCTNLDSTAQVVNGLPVLSVTGLNSGYCVDASAATLTATPSGGTFFGPGLSGNVFTPSVAGAGVYGLLYYYTDANGCFSSTSLPTEVYALPVVSFTGLNAGYCLDAAAATLTPSPAGGTFTGAGMAANVFSPSVAGVGTTSILYSYTDANSCTNSASIPTEVYGLPTVTLRTDTTICAVNNTVLDAGTFTSYLWNTGAITQSITVDTTNYGIGAFNYSVIVGDIHNCTATDSVEITYEATPVSMLTDSATICGEDASLILDAGANALYTYLWNDASTTSSITVDSAIIGGLMNYMYVTISSPAGCTESDSTHVYFRAVPMPNVGNDTTICWTQNIVFDAGAGYTSYLWSNGAITQTISLDSLTFALGANDYSVEVYNDVNCNNSDTITLIIDPCTGILTPEIIGADILVYPNPTKGQFQIDISGLDNQDYELGIYNSFGSKVFGDNIQSSGQSTQSWNIDLSTYAKGIYFIRLQSKDQIKVQRIIIQ